MRRAGKWVAVCIAAASLAASCSWGDDDGVRSSPTTTAEAAEPDETVDADPVVPADGDVLVEVEGVGEILEGFAVFETDTPDVEASEAGSVPDLDGVLAEGPGLVGEVETPFTGALQVRLGVPEPPTDDAIPVAVHRDSDGRVSIEPALWDPGTSQMVVWVTSLSDRWGAWFDPRNWTEEVVQVEQGSSGFVADFVTGRTDPPACRDDPPGWATVSANEASSLHVCAQGSPADDGSERFELLLTSNRRAAQLVMVPSPATDYVLTENMPDDRRQLLTSLAGADANTSVTLLGALSMSVGFRQPEQGFDVEMLAYETPRIIAANQVFALLGNLPLDGTLAALAAVSQCHSEASGIDITRFDAVPDGDPPDADLLDGVVRCAFEALQHPELAFGVVQEVAGEIGMTDAAVLDDIDVALRALAPTAERIASGVAIGSTLTNLRDGILGNLADGHVTVSLTGTEPTAVETDLAGANFGIVTGFDPARMLLTFDAATLYEEEAAKEYKVQQGDWTSLYCESPNGSDGYYDGSQNLADCELTGASTVIVNDNPRLRDLSVSPSATVSLVTLADGTGRSTPASLSDLPAHIARFPVAYYSISVDGGFVTRIEQFFIS